MSYWQLVSITSTAIVASLLLVLAVHAALYWSRRFTSKWMNVVLIAACLVLFVFGIPLLMGLGTAAS